jgi:hypothetical protein
MVNVPLFKFPKSNRGYFSKEVMNISFCPLKADTGIDMMGSAAERFQHILRHCFIRDEWLFCKALFTVDIKEMNTLFGSVSILSVLEIIYFAGLAYDGGVG